MFPVNSSVGEAQSLAVNPEAERGIEVLDEVKLGNGRTLKDLLFGPAEVS
jgi:hypothetical protein